MSYSLVLPVGHDGGMDSSRPRSGGPKPRRSFTPAQKLAHLAAYDAACVSHKGGAYLREQGLYSSQVTEWRKQRDAGVLDTAHPGAKVARLTPEQAEIARLRRELELTSGKLARTEVALQIMGKVHVLLDDLSKSTEPDSTGGTC